MRGNTFALSYVLQRRKKYLSTDSQFQISVLYLNHNFVHNSKSNVLSSIVHQRTSNDKIEYCRHVLFMYYHHISGSQRE